MLKSALLIVGAIAIIASWQTTSQPLTSVDLPPDLQRVLTDYEAAWQSKDSEALSKLFAEDGFVLPNGRMPVRGRAAIKVFYSNAGGDLSLRAFAYSAEGKTSFIVGGYSSKKGESDTGKFTLTLKRGENGKWLIFSDMDNGNKRP